MSDEKIKHLESLYDQLSNWSVGIDLHIEKLEKKFNWKILFQETCFNDDGSSKIEELEKKVEALDKDILDTICKESAKHNYNLLEKEIAELRDDLSKAGVKWDFRLDEQGGFINELRERTDQQQIEIDGYKHQLTELKEHVIRVDYAVNERIDELKEQFKYMDKYCDQTVINYEVLREHLKGHLRVYELIDSVDKPVDTEWKKHLEGQLAKLDGSRTVKVDATNFDDRLGQFLRGFKKETEGKDVNSPYWKGFREGGLAMKETEKMRNLSPLGDRSDLYNSPLLKAVNLKEKEKKEFIKCSNNYGHEWNLDYKCVHCNVGIASGGEKVRSAAHTEVLIPDETMYGFVYEEGKSKTKELTETKPPEPKNVCSTCGNMDNDFANSPCKTCNTLYVNWKPREDDALEYITEDHMKEYFRKRGYEFVKREKIDFWRKELLNKTDEVLKSMREVLGIE